MTQNNNANTNTNTNTNTAPQALAEAIVWFLNLQKRWMPNTSAMRRNLRRRGGVEIGNGTFAFPSLVPVSFPALNLMVRVVDTHQGQRLLPWIYTENWDIRANSLSGLTAWYGPKQIVHSTTDHCIEHEVAEVAEGMFPAYSFLVPGKAIPWNVIEVRVPHF